MTLRLRFRGDRMTGARRAVRWALLLTALVSASSSVSAQAATPASAVSGTVLNAVTGAPIAGVVLEALDAAGTVRERRLTTAAGRFLFTGDTMTAAGTAGTARAVVTQVRARRIGYAPVTVAMGQPPEASVTIHMRPLPTLLPTVAVRSARGCRDDDAHRRGRAAMDGARDALLASVVSDVDRPASVWLIHYAAQRDEQGTMRGLPTLSHDTLVTGGPTWEAVRTPRAFADSGFLRDIDGDRFFMAPDASLLADEVFIGNWCFTLADARVARAEREAKGDASATTSPHAVAIQFAPARRRTAQVDIAGRIWIDTVARTLDRVEYEWLGLPSGESTARSGGVLSFRALPNGATVVEAWSMRLPAPRVEAVRNINGLDLAMMRPGTQETGGLLAWAMFADGDTWTLARDQARLFAAEIPEWVRDTARWRAPLVADVVPADSADPNSLAERDSLAARTARAAAQDTASLRVRVVDVDNLPIGDAEVFVVQLGRTVRTDADGVARVSAVAVGHYDVGVRRVGFLPRSTTVIAHRDSVAPHYVALISLTTRIAPVLTTARRTGLFGFVSDTALRPLANARVSVAGSGRSTRTDATGAFNMDVRPRSYMVRVERDGFVAQSFGVTVPRDSGRQVAVRLSHETRRDRALRAVEMVRQFELDRRMLRASPATTRYFTRDQLLALGITDMSQLMRRWASGAITAYCLVEMNESAQPYRLPVTSVYTDEVEFVELYTPSIARREMPRGMTSLSGNPTRFVASTGGVSGGGPPSCGNVRLIVWPRRS